MTVYKELLLYPDQFSTIVYLLWFNFILGLKFYFPLFWGILMYDNEFKTWSCDNFITPAMLFMALHAVACMHDCSMTFLMLNFNSVKNSSCCKK